MYSCISIPHVTWNEIGYVYSHAYMQCTYYTTMIVGVAIHVPESNPHSQNMLVLTGNKH